MILTIANVDVYPEICFSFRNSQEKLKGTYTIDEYTQFPGLTINIHVNTGFKLTSIEFLGTISKYMLTPSLETLKVEVFGNDLLCFWGKNPKKYTLLGCKNEFIGEFATENILMNIGFLQGKDDKINGIIFPNYLDYLDSNTFNEINYSKYNFAEGENNQKTYIIKKQNIIKHNFKFHNTLLL